MTWYLKQPVEEVDMTINYAMLSDRYNLDCMWLVWFDSSPISPYLHSLLLSNNVRCLHRPLHWKSPVLALPVKTSTHLLGQQRPSALSRIMRRGLLLRSDATLAGLPSSWLGNTSSSSPLPPMTLICSFYPWSSYVTLRKLLTPASHANNLFLTSMIIIY